MLPAGTKVLLVDDERDIRRVCELSLQGVCNWVVTTASSGAEALEFLSTGPFDVILLDVMMPELDGLCVLARMRERSGAELPPVIFMTAKVQKHELAQYLAAGAAGVIEKPFDPMELGQHISQIVRKNVPAQEQAHAQTRDRC